jgi:hypothetical protein
MIASILLFSNNRRSTFSLLVVRELVDHLIEACGYGLKFGEILGFKPPSVLALANVAEL